MRARVDPERLQAAQVQLLRVAGVRLEDDLRRAPRVVGLGLGYSRQALLPPVGRLAWMRLAWALAEQVRRPSGLQTWQC